MIKLHGLKPAYCNLDTRLNLAFCNLDSAFCNLDELTFLLN